MNNITLGRHSYVHDNRAYNYWNVAVEVGNYTSIAHDLAILGGQGQHPPVLHPQAVSTYPFREMLGCAAYYPCQGRGKVVIGNDVWVGHGVTILDGVSVGDGAIIGARAVVAKTVHPYAVVVGNPMREVKKRFPDPVVAALLRIRWWDWPHEKVMNNLRLFMDVESFVRQFDPEAGQCR